MKQDTTHPSIAPRRGMRPGTFSLIVLLMAIFSNAVFITIRNPFRELNEDGPAYMSVAQNLAHGRGFFNDFSPWRTRPATNINPGWPFIAAVFTKLLPAMPPTLVMRITAAVLNSLTAVLLARLTFTLTGQFMAATLVGCFYAVYPTALYLVDAGMGEISLVCILILCIQALLNRYHYTAAVLLGYCCIIRHNILGLLPVLALIFCIHSGARKALFGQMAFKTMLLCGLLFVAPLSLWTIRNYTVTGHFPVVNSQNGITLQCANNAIVADTLEYWGYCVQQGELPGQIQHQDLAATFASQYDADEYLRGMATQFIKEHWRAYPRLLLGRLVRGYVPVPWHPEWALIGAAAVRFLLYAIFAATAALWMRRIDRSYLLLLCAFAIVSVGSTVMAFGCARYSFWLEVIMMPCATFGITAVYTRWKHKSLDAHQLFSEKVAL